MTKEKKQKQGIIYHIKTMVYKLLSKSVKEFTIEDYNYTREEWRLVLQNREQLLEIIRINKKIKYVSNWILGLSITSLSLSALWVIRLFLG